MGPERIHAGRQSRNVSGRVVHEQPPLHQSGTDRGAAPNERANGYVSRMVAPSLPAGRAMRVRRATPTGPDLQEWVRRHGSYWNIPWAEWDHANTFFQMKLRYGDSDG